MLNFKNQSDRSLIFKQIFEHKSHSILNSIESLYLPFLHLCIISASRTKILHHCLLLLPHASICLPLFCFPSTSIHIYILSFAQSRSVFSYIYLLSTSRIYNNSPFYSFSRIHPPLFSRVLAWPSWLLKACTFITNHLFVTNMKIILVTARSMFLHCCIFVVLCLFFYYLTDLIPSVWLFCPR